MRPTGEFFSNIVPSWPKRFEERYEGLFLKYRPSLPQFGATIFEFVPTLLTTALCSVWRTSERFRRSLLPQHEELLAAGLLADSIYLLGR